jgi:hypothetical protein
MGAFLKPKRKSYLGARKAQEALRLKQRKGSFASIRDAKKHFLEAKASEKMLQKALFIAKASTKVFKKAWLEAKLEKRAVSSLLSSQLLDRKKAREAVVSTLLVSESVARDAVFLETLLNEGTQKTNDNRHAIQDILKAEVYTNTTMLAIPLPFEKFLNNLSAVTDFLSRMKKFVKIKRKEYLDAKRAQPALRLTHSRILEEWIRAHALTT